MPDSVTFVTAEHTMDVWLFVATCFVLILTLLYILNNWNNKTTANFPPGPKCWPLIGNLHIMNLKKPHLTYLELAKTYGSVFSVQMGKKKIVVLAGYETVKDALVNHAEEFGERARAEIFQDMDKNMGIVLSSGDNWKVMRRFTILTLRDFGMGKSTIEDKIVEECTHLTEHVASFRGKQSDDTMIINAAVANIIVAILLGHRMNYEDPQFRRLLTLTNENIRLLGSPMVSIYNVYPILGFLPGSHKTIVKNVDELTEFITRTFVKHLKTLDENDPRSFIDAFLLRQKEEANNSQSYFHNDNLTRVVRNLFTAGMETTSTTLCWGLLLMVKYPNVQECMHSRPEVSIDLLGVCRATIFQLMVTTDDEHRSEEKVQDEISGVVGSAQLSYSQRGQMPFTNAVIHEIQRFSDIIPLNLPHETTRDVTFKGYVIPKGTLIIPLLSSVLKDKTQFEKPDEFYPNHFLDNKGNFIKKDAFMPFSAGHRVCAGETLARMELFIFFTSLLQKFTFRLPPGVSYVDLSPGGGFTNVPKKHMICAVPRF